MDKIVKFVECLIPIASCNLKCSYCYVVQENRRNNLVDKMTVTPNIVGKAFAKERWGGTMLVNLCGYGETLAQGEIVDIIREILAQGHYVNITNNGTMSVKIDQLTELPKDYRERLCFAFSLHYVELKKKDLLDVFTENVKKVKSAGCSFLIQLNLCDEYIEIEKEIKDYCIQNFGALPQIALTRREGAEYSLFTNRTEDEYINQGRTYKSPLWDFTCRNFNVIRKEFCYAGKWSYKIDIATGILRSCYFSSPFFNIYKDLNKKIPTLTVGNNCRNPYCVNSSHFMSLGVIPSIDCEYYGDLRNRKEGGWYIEKYLQFVNQKLSENNQEYAEVEKVLVNCKYRSFELYNRFVSLFKRIISKDQ